jgi:hypothetical protein
MVTDRANLTGSLRGSLGFALGVLSCWGLMGCNRDPYYVPRVERPPGDASPGVTIDGGEAALSVRVGIPDEETGLQYTELELDGDIRVQRGGQGGSHALVALQCRGLGNKVFFQAGVHNLDGDGEVFSALLPRPRPIACDDDGLCNISPVFVQLGGVAPREEWDGLHVELSGRVWNEAGLEASGTALGYLREDKDGAIVDAGFGPPPEGGDEALYPTESGSTSAEEEDAATVLDAGDTGAIRDASHIDDAGGAEGVGK